MFHPCVSSLRNVVYDLSGGAVYADDVTATNFASCEFADNDAGWHGGALYLKGNASFTSSTFTDNSARSGGAVYTSGDRVPFTECTFTENAALLYHGGWVHVQVGLVDKII